MSDDIQDIFKKKINPPKFKRTIGLFGATTIGVGSLLGAGIYVLIGAAANIAGPSVVFSYLLCGSLAFVTTLMYADLSRAIPRSGGGYTYAYDILGSLGGFSTGWFLALGSILASSLYAIGFAEYAVSLFGGHLSGVYIKLIAIAVTSLVTIFILRPAGNSKFNFQNWIVWGNVAILLLLIVMSIINFDVDIATPVFPNGFKGTMGAISIIYISFFGYQLIANNSDEIIEPEKTVPKAMKLSMLISIALYVLVAITAVFTVSWKDLAASSAPLVLLANKSFGGNGWLIISIGGVFASLGALSSTLLSQSRQAYSMGKDRFFPDFMGELNDKTKQPQWAIIIGGVLVGIVLIFLDLETIAKVTNFSLLLSLLPISFALRKLYKDKPELKPTSKFKRYLPEISLVINLGLLLTMDIFSLAAGQQLVVAGVLIYFFYSRKREQSGREGRNIVLKEKTSFSFTRRNKVLVPVANPDTQKKLLLLSSVLMAKKGGEIVVLAVKDVPKNMGFYEALSDAGETLDVIKQSVEFGKQNGINFKPIIRASRNIPLGIVNSAKDENCDLLIIGFPQHTNEYNGTILEKVLKTTNTDILILNFKASVEKFIPKTIGVYVKNSRNLYLMLMTAAAVAEKENARIILFSYLPRKYTKQQKTKIDTLIRESLVHLKSTALYSVELLSSDNADEEIINRSSDFDLLIMGKDFKSRNKTLEDLPSFKITREAKCSVILVKTANILDKIAQSI